MTVPRKDLIRRRFSEAAPRYGVLAEVQKGIAAALAGRVKAMKSECVLDVGAGDGVLTRALAKTGAHFVSLDSAWGMVRMGKEQRCADLWVQADACALPFASKSFDSLVSSSVYQWVDDLPLAFKEARRVVKPGGKIMIAMFGQRTLSEFFESLESAAKGLKKKLPPLKRLAGADEIRRAIKAAGIKEVEISTEERYTSFISVTALLVWLKGIGANSLSGKFFWGKGLLASTEREYRERFLKDERLRAGFEVIWIEATV